MDELPSITPRKAKNPETYLPYNRDPETLAREWAIPGMEGFEHRIGGLEKNNAGGVNQDPENLDPVDDSHRDQKWARRR